jgi:hypothetical protein
MWRKDIEVPYSTGKVPPSKEPRRFVAWISATILALLAVGAAARAAGAAAGKEARAAAPAPVDVAAVRDRMQVLGDGRGHYVALLPFAAGADRDHTYYGDGKRFYALRVGTSSSSGREAFALSFWDPRFRDGVSREVRLRDGRYSVSCGARDTEMKALPAAEAAPLLAGASFFAPLWRWKAYALSRDERGNYYYVDRQRDPPDSRSFRIYAGQRGKLKRLDMTNVVSDSEGEIFVTKTGKLWLIFGKQESFWIQGKGKKTLTNVPVEDNAAMIYDENGAYPGQRLGTPCDDL